MRLRDAIRNDLLVLDRMAECADCHELNHAGSTVCDGCGSRLYPTANETARLATCGGRASRAEGGRS